VRATMLEFAFWEVFAGYSRGLLRLKGRGSSRFQIENVRRGFPRSWQISVTAFPFLFSAVVLGAVRAAGSCARC